MSSRTPTRATGPADRPVGRETLLARARAALHPGAGLLLTGPAGIGASTLLRTLAQEAAAAGGSVLRCEPAADEAALPYAALIDLFRTVPDRLTALLPGRQYRALHSALLRGGEPGTDLDRLTLRVAVAGALELIGRDAPVLLVLDGLQHLDRPSAEALAHTVRRAPELGVTVAASAHRAAEASGLLPPAHLRLAVPGLPDDALTAILAGDGSGDTPAADPARLRRILHLAAGNPRYARELAAAEPGPDGRPTVPPQLRALLLRPAADLPPTARTALLLAATAGSPGLGLLRSAGVADPVAALAAAEQRGLVAVAADGRIALAHPLLAAALRDDARTAERLAVHEALAGAVQEPVERARHLALARPYEDPQVARALSEAAATAAGRGSADTAYELAALAVARTPADRPEDRHQRLLAAAFHAADAGRHAEARRAADQVLAETADATRRVHARLALLETAGQALDDARGLIEGGLADAAGTPALQARLRFWSAVRELLGGRTAGAASQAQLAAGLAAQGADRATGVDALGLLATVESMRGRPAAAETALGSALRLAEHGGSTANAGLLRRKALFDLDADRVAQASRQIAALAERGLGSGPGSVQDSLATLVAQARIQARAGECRPALATADRVAGLLQDAGLASPLGDYAAALAEAVGGSAPRATELARAAVDGSAADGDRLFQVRALGVLGGAQLLTGRVQAAAAAAEVLQRARELGQAMGLADPDAVRRLGDLAEALVLLGEPGEARLVLADATAAARTWPRHWGTGALAALDRADGLALAALGRPEEGVAALRRSAEALRTVPLPLDLARTLAGWGAVERRARHRSSARAVLEEAEQLCRAHQALPLLRRVQQEQERLAPGERAGATTELTASERRVAELVAGGATNREVAAALYVSVKTVEGTLSRVYRKLGVRSRTGLARADTGGHVEFTSTARVPPLIGGRGAS
jgi:DNA-binding CsgD family transcriptional regulator